jgi:hypothetical protein
MTNKTGPAAAERRFVALSVDVLISAGSAFFTWIASTHPSSVS